MALKITSKLERSTKIDVAAEELGLFPKTLRNYIKQGCPCDPPGAHGVYFRFNVGEVATWMKSNGMTGKPGRPDASDGSLGNLIKAAQLRKTNAQAERYELELAHAKGALIEREEEEKSDLAKIALVKNGMLGMSEALAPQLVGMTVSEIQTTIDAEVLNLLKVFSRS